MNSFLSIFVAGWNFIFLKESRYRLFRLLLLLSLLFVFFARRNHMRWVMETFAGRTIDRKMKNCSIAGSICCSLCHFSHIQSDVEWRSFIVSSSGFEFFIISCCAWLKKLFLSSFFRFGLQIRKLCLSLERPWYREHYLIEATSNEIFFVIYRLLELRKRSELGVVHE